jgi:hypothetical protein
MGAGGITVFKDMVTRTKPCLLISYEELKKKVLTILCISRIADESRTVQGTTGHHRMDVVKRPVTFDSHLVLKRLLSFVKFSGYD